MTQALFLDRDGTINEDPGYLGDPSLVKLLDGVGESLSFLKNDLNFMLIVVSNQSGIARGLITEEDVKSVNDEINNLLSEYNVKIDKFYYCAYHPDFNTPEECDSRKPSPKMILDAAKEFDIDLNKSYLIGDMSSDILSGLNAGVKTILVKTGYGKSQISSLSNLKIIPNFVAENFKEACEFIKKDFNNN